MVFLCLFTIGKPIDKFFVKAMKIKLNDKENRLVMYTEIL